MGHENKTKATNTGASHGVAATIGQSCEVRATTGQDQSCNTKANIGQTVPSQAKSIRHVCCDEATTGQGRARATMGQAHSTEATMGPRTIIPEDHHWPTQRTRLIWPRHQYKGIIADAKPPHVGATLTSEAITGQRKAPPDPSSGAMAIIGQGRS